MIELRKIPETPWMMRTICIVLIDAVVFSLIQALGCLGIIKLWRVDNETDTCILDFHMHQVLTLPLLRTTLSTEAKANGETHSVEIKTRSIHSSAKYLLPYALNVDTGKKQHG